MKNAILERELIRRAHVFSVRDCMPDGRVQALLTNRDRYIQQSAQTIGRLPAHPPVPSHKALVPCPSPAASPRAESAFSPKAPAADPYLNLCDDREPSLPCGYAAPTHYLEF